MTHRAVLLSLVLAPVLCPADTDIDDPAAEAVEDRKTPIVKNGGFEHVDPEDPSKPQYWFKPDGLGVQWTNEPGRGKVMRIDTSISEKDMVTRWKEAGLTNFWDIPEPADNAVAATYGLSYYSDAFPATKGQAYRVTFDFKTTASGGGAKLWVRGYGMIKGRHRRRYETIVNCRDGGKAWKPFSQAFHPTRLRPKVTELKVMLYAYWPPGVYWFDNVKIEPISNEDYEKSRRTP